MLGNLLDNACMWARPTVLVRSRAAGTKVDIAIEDYGPGLSAEQAADVVKPGHQLDEDAPATASDCRSRASWSNCTGAP